MNPAAGPVTGPPAGKRRAPRTAVLVVNGFDRRGRWGSYNEDEAREFPWVRLCLDQIAKHSRGSSYEVLVWDNSWMPEHRAVIEADPKVRMFSPAKEGDEIRHGTALDQLVKKVRPGTKFIITLDTDSFPIRNGWIENLTGRLDDETLLAGVWRDEMVPRKPAFIHPCCLAVRRRTLKELGASFRVGKAADVGHQVMLAVEERGARVSRLRRSNHWNPHFLMGAVYGDLVYHQGAGSRAPVFSADSDNDHDEAVRLALRDAAFSDLESLLDVLAGNLEPAAVPALAALGPSEDQDAGPAEAQAPAPS